MARYDALTGLANRALFMEKAAEWITRMQEHGECFWVLMLDLDRFKAVNDVLGHAIGDTLLQAVAERLRQLVRDVDCVARLGGDEFAIIQPVGKDATRGAALGNTNPRIHHQALRSRWPQDRHWDKHRNHAGAAGCQDADALVRCADLALYKAEIRGQKPLSLL